AVDAIDVTIARDNAPHFAGARAERHLAAVRTEITGRNGLRELPRTRLVTISRVEQCSRRANFDAVAALRAIKPAHVRADNGVCAAAAGFDRLFAHPLVANARAALAENAALRIVRHHRREIALGVVVLAFGEAFFEAAPVKRHLLQLTLAAAIAHR